MGVLQRFERRVEGLVQGAFARAFGGYVEPVEVAAALTREAEDRKSVVGQGRVLVPNHYVVELGSSDGARLREYDVALRNELASMVKEAAQEHGWSFVGPVEVVFQDDPGIKTGTFTVRSGVVEGGQPAPGGTQPRPEPRPEPRPGPRPEPRPEPRYEPTYEPTYGASGDQPTTYLPAAPSAFVEMDGRRLPIGERTVFGRGSDATVRLPDTGVSRRHAELRLYGRTAELTDLGSTNGTTLNGRRITGTTLLQDGDQLVLGTTTLVFRTGT